MSPDQIREYFENLKKELEGIPPTHIINCDETSMRDDPSAKAAIFRKGVRYPEQVKDHSKTCFSTMFACTAAGELLPTMTVFKSPSGNFYDTWATGAPQGSVFSANKAGWFNMRECEVWLEKVLLVWLEGRIPKEEVKVLIMDNLSSHLSLKIIELCREHNIRLVFLPANSTHLTQPLDVAVFAAIKKQWREELDEFKEWCVRNNVRNVTIPKDKFGGLLKAMLEKNVINNANNIKAGFAACGIYPLNVNRVLSRLPPETDERQNVQDRLSQQLLDQLKKNRYGDQEKKTRAKKINRLPAGTAYTVSAVAEQVTVEGDGPGPSGVGRAAGGGRGAGGGR